ncbi:MAG: MFS transporter [Desulfatirhabdiaceae bacterium]
MTVHRESPQMASLPNPRFGRGIFNVKIIIRAQYFLYFAIMGLYLPYFNLYLSHIQLTGFQIGALSALRSVLLVIFPIVWGLVADRLQARRAVYILCNIISASIWAFYIYTTDFKWLLLITLCYGIFYAPIISFLESFTMDTLGSEKLRYGQTRVWGSIAFIAIVLLTGKLIDLYPVNLILILILSFGLIQSAAAFGLPEFRIKKNPKQFGDMRKLTSSDSIMFLICACLMLMSHGAYYGFFSIHLEKLGFDATFIGICWAVASISEIVVMIRSETFFRRFSLENVLVFSFVVAGGRWFLLSVAVSGPVILIVQILHAITYGAFHMASILYIDRMSSETSKTLGQAVNNAVSYGLGLMAGFFMSGYLFEIVGARMVFIISGCIALTGGAMLKLYQTGFHNRRKSRHV